MWLEWYKKLGAWRAALLWEKQVNFMAAFLTEKRSRLRPFISQLHPGACYKIGLNWSQHAGSALMDLVFPRSCIFCHAPYPADLPHICDACQRTLGYIAPNACCLRCGAPFYGEVSGPKCCPRCLDRRLYFQSGRSVLSLEGRGRDLIHAFKYRGDFYLLRDWIAMMKKIPSLDTFIEKTILVPVPLHVSKLRLRGYNQSELIARALRRWQPSVQIQSLLVRTRKTVSQTQLSRDDRLGNVKGAFSIRKKGTVLSPDRRYLLIDDVYTTGATLNACAKCLWQNGARHIDIFTLGHG